MAAGGPIWSNLSDIFGRKVVLLAAVSMFFGSSIICAVAGNIGGLIFGRVMQGLAGGGLFLLVNILISDLFSVRLVLCTSSVPCHSADTLNTENEVCILDF